MYWIEDVGTGYILKQGDENQGWSRDCCCSVLQRDLNGCFVLDILHLLSVLLSTKILL